MTVLQLDEATLVGLEQFEKVEEMNEAVRGHRERFDLSVTDRAILDVISQYACKYVGVCFLSKQKIAEAAGFKSRRTAIRACNRLEKLGVIKQYETRRMKGDRRQSVNLIVIQKCQVSQQEVTGESHPEEAPDKTPIKTHTYDTSIDTEDVYKKGLRASIPEAFFDAFSPFFNARELYDVYGILLRAKASVKVLFRLEDYAEEYIANFYNVVRLYKWGKVDNLYGYLYRAWEALTLQLHRKDVYEKRLLPEEYYVYEEE